jgi:pilus assembly protein Flp/PilA
MLDYAKTWLALRFDKRGVTAMEYGLIAALIAVVIITGVTAVGSKLEALFMQISTTLSGTTG